MSAFTVFIIANAVLLLAALFMYHTQEGRMSEALFGFCVGLSMLLFLSLLMAGLGNLERKQCFAKADSMGLRSEWGYMKTCVVFPGDGPGIPLDNYRGTEGVER